MHLRTRSVCCAQEAMEETQREAATLQQELAIYTGWEENSRREPVEKFFDAAYEGHAAEL